MSVEQLERLKGVNILAQQVPELFGWDAASSLKEGLLSAETISVWHNYEQQRKYSFQKCRIGSENYDVALLRICHLDSMQQSTEIYWNIVNSNEAIKDPQNMQNFQRIQHIPEMENLLNPAQIIYYHSIPQYYGGWFIQLDTSQRNQDHQLPGLPVKTLRIRWGGSERKGSSTILSIGHTDMDGSGRRMDFHIENGDIISAQQTGDTFVCDVSVCDSNIVVKLSKYPYETSPDSCLSLPLSVHAIL
jgi:hypothetical protein